MIRRKDIITAAFSAAAAGYEAAAEIQDRVARRLADRVAALPPLPSEAMGVELGCGTGLLTRRLLAILPEDARLLATDLSPAMVAQAQGATHDPRAAFAVMDAEAPALPAGTVQLMASSLAAQWFTDLQGTLAALSEALAPGGHLMLATLGGGTFSEWRAAHVAQGLVSGSPDYPDAATLAALAPADCHIQVESESLTSHHADGRTFLKALAAIGAATPRPDHRPLTPGQMRRVLAALGKPCAITWDILFLTCTKKD
ncbi:SAM-dependent methyltransferase [Candidatus Terasakiella magnetica]|nr:SAM-dependent methyltransferase [Candidatus Terasakiella magnetica]